MFCYLSFGNSVTRGCLVMQLFLVCAGPCLADELEPRRWSHLPIDTNFFGAGYDYIEADISFDPVLKLENVEMELDNWAAKYIRTFALFNKTARIGILQAYQEGRWSGLVDRYSHVNQPEWLGRHITAIRHQSVWCAPAARQGIRCIPDSRLRLKPSLEQACRVQFPQATIWTIN